MFTVKLVHLLLTISSEWENICSGKSLSAKKNSKIYLHGCRKHFVLFLAIFNFGVEKYICGGSIQTIISGVYVTFFN